MNSLTFQDGDSMPVIGLGTWKSKAGEVGNAVHSALVAGYRHIDCAAIYGNEAEIGNALTHYFDEGKITRDEVWITSKLWNNAHREEDVIPALKSTLNDLKLEYLDLYLIHWPVAFKPDLDGFPESDEDYLALDKVPISETWNAMIKAKEQGLVNHLGVSNFSVDKLDDLISKTGYTPEMNQVELHPYLQQDDLLDYSRDRNIHITAYSPLGSTDRPDEMKADDEPSLLDNEIITSIAVKHNATPAQILIAWHLHRGTAVIPKSTNPGRIEENLNSRKIELDDTDMNQIKAMDRDYRYLDGSFFETKNDMYRNIFDE